MTQFVSVNGEGEIFPNLTDAIDFETVVEIEGLALGVSSYLFYFWETEYHGEPWVITRQVICNDNREERPG